jgi:8-oxo-dGTP pyrophosphatase MutT (NUDIX family)
MALRVSAVYRTPLLRCCGLVSRFSSSSSYNPGNTDNYDRSRKQSHHRVWKADPDSKGSVNYWKDRVIDKPDGGKDAINALVKRISDEEGQGGRMRQNQLGVLHQDPATDMQMLIDNYTVKAVASALRDREDALQQAAVLAADGRFDELQTFLQIFHPKYVLERRRMATRTNSHMLYDSERHTPDISALDDPVTSLSDASRQVLRKALMRMPRTVTTAHSKRAAVCLALCLSDNVPSILLEKRAAHLRTHPDEVCLPGGMVCDIQDQTIVSTSIREMKEEIGGLGEDDARIEVIGILRLNWGEVQHLTGVAVTPVVCYLGELPDELSPNPDEVSEVFTIPLADLLDKSLWVRKEGLAPIFVGGPHVIWGLTGYILERLAVELGRLRAA